MKHVKMLGLAAAAAMALTALFGAGTASASKICSTNIDPCPAGWHWPTGTKIDFSVPAGGSLILKDTFNNVLYTCTEATLKGETTNTGSSTETVKGKVTSMTWGSTTTPCTHTTDTVANPELEIHAIANSGGNGTLTGKGGEVTVTSIAGDCVYTLGTTFKSVGDITEGKVAAGSTSPILHINTTVSELSGFCPSTEKWEGTMVMTEPTNTTAYVTAG
jgi:hypothetical protein